MNGGVEDTMSKGLLIALALLAGPAAAQDAARGAELFAGHCAACHGAAAEGDGPMTAVLAVAPPDLTGLAAAEGGTFPMERVVRSVDGRSMILAHGGAMPLFGRILEGEGAVYDAADGTPVITKAAVLDIAAWLASRQD
jgi:mono/diheme cytochrome c family protein